MASRGPQGDRIRFGGRLGPLEAILAPKAILEAILDPKTTKKTQTPKKSMFFWILKVWT